MSGALGESVQLVLGALNTSALRTLLLAAAWIGVLGVGLGIPGRRVLGGFGGCWIGEEALSDLGLGAASFSCCSSG